jgi:predicted HAD superfamily phosphohydrolase YqeG
MMAGQRTPWFLVDDLVTAAALAARHSDLLVVDIENTLVGYGSSARKRHDAMVAALEEVAASGGLRRLAFVSNARLPLPTVAHPALEVHLVTAARKPYVRLPPLRRLRAELAGAAVYGDQPLTDGMLARNLGGIWLQPRHAHDPISYEPPWPSLMRAVGRRILDRRFRLTPDPPVS